MSFRGKIVARSALAQRMAGLPRPLVFTNGVFDILHPGHVEYLERASALGSTLIVGLNSDSSVRQLEKGADRPINPEAERAVMLAALESVTLVTLFTERTPLELLQEIRPNLYVKGGDYDIDSLEEARFVRSYGGDARAIAFSEGYSTTAFLRRIRASMF